jgi:DNA recombination-dependent growth factor C
VGMSAVGFSAHAGVTAIVGVDLWCFQVAMRWALKIHFLVHEYFECKRVSLFDRMRVT